MCTHPTQFGACGHCRECRRQRANEWGYRMLFESLEHDGNSFLTLTYKPECLPKDGVSRSDIKSFFKKLRKKIKFRYYGASEYGSKYQRPHYHIAMFGVPVDSPIYKNRRWSQSAKVYYVDMSEWDKGFCSVGTLTPASMRYVSKYIQKKWLGSSGNEHYKKLALNPEFSFMSLKPGIGFNYFFEHADEIKRDGFVRLGKKKVAIPRYFVKKFFSDWEREQRNQEYQEKKKQKVKEQFDADVKSGGMYAWTIPAERRKQRDLNMKAREEQKKGQLDG